MTALFGKSTTSAHSGGRPPAAIEISPEGVVAAAIPARGALPVFAFEPVRAGAVSPGITDSNVRHSDALANSIRAALDSVSPRSRSVTVIVPDTSVRVFVLDFDAFPARPAEAIAVLRFRLRRMVPFDVEHAGLSYQILSDSKAEVRVLVAIIPSTILEEYERAVKEAGYEPGAVMPSTLSALAAFGAASPALAACLSRAAITTSITQGDDLLLYRTLELPEDPEQRLLEVQRSIAVAAAYYEDKISVLPRELHFSGNGAAAEFEQWFGPSELKIVDLAPRPGVGVATSLGDRSVAGVSGALAGAT